LAMAEALERSVAPAPASAVGDWVRRLVGDELDARAARIAEIERATVVSGRAASRPAVRSRAPAVLAAAALGLVVVAGVVAIAWPRAAARRPPDPAEAIAPSAAPSA